MTAPPTAERLVAAARSIPEMSVGLTLGVVLFIPLVLSAYGAYLLLCWVGAAAVAQGHDPTAAVTVTAVGVVVVVAMLLLAARLVAEVRRARAVTR